MVFSFARVSAALGMKVEDYYTEGRRAWFRLHEKGGKRHEVPAHHNADDYLDAYIAAAGIAAEKKTPLFRSIDRHRHADRPADGPPATPSNDQTPGQGRRPARRRSAATPSGPPASPPTSRTAAPSSTPSTSPTTKARRRPSSMTAPATRSRSMRSRKSLSKDPAQPVSVAFYINLGNSIGTLMHSDLRGYDHVSATLRQLLESSVIINDDSHDIATLFTFITDVEKAYEENPESFNPNFPTEFYHRLKPILFHYHRLIHSSAFIGQKVLPVENNVVTESLRLLLQDITNDQERIILLDTLRCLECGAYRAAIVMGWNLTYERIRHWIFKSPRKRRREFNTALTTKHPKHAPIAQYEDFYEVGERKVLDIAYDAELFTKQKYQILVNSLYDRHHFAHASKRKATPATAAGYIENLIINILNDKHFK